MQCCFHIDASSQAMNLKIVATHGVKFKLRSRMYMDDELSLCLLAEYRRRFGHLHGPGDILFPAVGKQSGSREVGIAAHASRPYATCSADMLPHHCNSLYCSTPVP